MPLLELPEWAITTPREHDYYLQMYNEYQGDVDNVDLTRCEYIDAKIFIAGLRGYSVPVVEDDDPDAPECLNHTPEEPTEHPPDMQPYYVLNFCDGTGDILQAAYLDRSEFEFLKRCLAARQEHTPTTLPAA